MRFPLINRAIDECHAHRQPSKDVVNQAASKWCAVEWMAYAVGIGTDHDWCYVIKATPHWFAQLDDNEYHTVRGMSFDPCSFKIGKARNAPHRQKSMQSGNASQLELILTIPGGLYTEKLLQSVAVIDGYERVGDSLQSGGRDWFVGDGEGFLEWHQIDDVSLMYDIPAYRDLATAYVDELAGAA